MRLRRALYISLICFLLFLSACATPEPGAMTSGTLQTHGGEHSSTAQAVENSDAPTATAQENDAAGGEEPAGTSEPGETVASSVQTMQSEIPGAQADVPEVPQETNEPAASPEESEEPSATSTADATPMAPYTQNTRISDVIADPALGEYGRLLFPVRSGYYSGDTLGDLRLTWYSHINPDKTVEIANYAKAHSLAGDTVFYSIYTPEEIAADPQKRDTGLFFFKGDPGAPFAVCCAGGGFAYVGAMQDSFPHALELSKMGYNAFALIYRPQAQLACEDLSRAIAFIFQHASELGVSTKGYSLWGGSAGARMVAWVGSYGTAAFGAGNYPKPAAVIMQYTGLDEYSAGDPPTFVAVGDSDGIANWQGMKARLDGMSALGIDTEFHVYPGLGHGFGLGEGTVAEGWINDAVAFWQDHM